MVSNFKKNLTDVASLQKYLMNHFTRSFLILSWLLVSSSIQFGVYQFSCKKKNNSKTPLLLYCLLTFCLYQTPPEYRLFKLFLQANFTDVSHYADIAEWKSLARSEVWLWLTPAPIHTGCTHYYSQQRVISVILLLSICRCITILSHLGSDKHQKRLFSLTYRSSVRV